MAAFSIHAIEGPPPDNLIRQWLKGTEITRHVDPPPLPWIQALQVCRAELHARHAHVAERSTVTCWSFDLRNLHVWDAYCGTLDVFSMREAGNPEGQLICGGGGGLTSGTGVPRRGLDKILAAPTTVLADLLPRKALPNPDHMCCIWQGQKKKASAAQMVRCIRLSRTSTIPRQTKFRVQDIVSVLAFNCHHEQQLFTNPLKPSGTS